MAREVRIVFTGLTVCLNLENKNETMGDPSVILVRTGHHRHEHERAHVRTIHDGDAPQHDPHIPFLAYERSSADVESTSGTAWSDVPDDDDFAYVPLNGVEVSIVQDDQKGPLSIHRSYGNLVVKKDDYWPAAKDRWNRRYVPRRGDKPDSEVVAAYMRLHTGEIRAGKRTGESWSFPVDDKPHDKHEQQFAFDIEYNRVPNDAGVITLVETCLDCGHFLRKHKFTPRDHVQILTLFIGNNTTADMQNAVNRRQAQNVAKGAHFVFINQIADATLGLGSGPIPTPIELPPNEGGLEGEGGPVSGTDGYCGPANGND